MVLLRMTAARRLQTGLVAGGAASIAVGAGLMAGVGAGLIAGGVLSAVYGLVMVDDGGKR